MSGLEPFPLTSLEIACGIVLGPGEPAREQLGDSSATPIAAFEHAVLEALERPPCLVSFSGGRDSSAALAIATRVARREGLPLPIPATNRFPTVELSDELEWQEIVISHLDLDDWFRNEVDDELDCVGSVATDVLRRHGLLWPFNAFFHVPLLLAARGGSLITGVGGDEVFGGSRWARAAAVLSGRVRPRPRDALTVALALAPPRLRVPVLRRRLDVTFPWLRPAALQCVLDAWAEQDAVEPFGWGKEFNWWRTLRYWQVSRRSLAVLAADADARIFHPFADPGFSQALTRLPTNGRFEGRSAAMEMLFGDVLPAAVIRRASKASFDGAFFNVHSRRLVDSWQGEGAELEYIDADVLRGTWTSPEPDARSFLLLQSAWLERERLAAPRRAQQGDTRSLEMALQPGQRVE